MLLNRLPAPLRSGILAGVMLAAALPPLLAPRHALAQGAELRHTVVPGDTLLRLAARFMEQPRRYQEIARLNGLGDEDVISPGQVIRIPAPYLKMQPEEATISSVKGAVSLGGAVASLGGKVGANAGGKAGGKAGAASDIVTGADGQVTLRLADGSEIRLQNNTSATFSELKRNPASGARAVAMQLNQGRIETDVTPATDEQSRFTIRTPSAAVGVRGTRFRAAALEGSASTEVLEGRVAASVGNASVNVGQGFGTTAQSGKPPLPPIPLLPAPGLAPLAAQVDVDAPELAFAPVAGAARYRALVAEDERFERVVSEGVGAAPLLRPAALRDGTYFFRARAIDSLGLEGFNADGRFIVRTTPRAPRVTDPAPGGALLQPNLARIDLVFRWEAEPAAGGGYLLQVAADPRFTQNLTEHKVAAPRQQVTLESSPRRTVYWRVRSLDAAGVPGPAGATQAFEMGMLPN